MILGSPDIKICEMISHGTQQRVSEAGRLAMVHSSTVIMHDYVSNRMKAG